MMISHSSVGSINLLESRISTFSNHLAASFGITFQINDGNKKPEANSLTKEQGDALLAMSLLQHISTGTSKGNAFLNRTTSHSGKRNFHCLRTSNKPNQSQLLYLFLLSPPTCQIPSALSMTR